MKNLAIALLLALGILACGQAPVNFEGGSLSKGELPVPQSPPPPSVQVSNSAAERKLIKNGNLNFIADDVEETRKHIEKICKDYNAYISSESKENFESRLQYHQEIRIPSAQFDALLKAVEELAEEIEGRNIRTDDVTEQFIDIEARLKTKKELEARYLSLLQQARTVNDILAIENQIAAIRADVESMQGKLNYLQDQVSYSTLVVTYYQNIGTDFGFASRFANAVGEGWDNLLLFLIGLTHLWPFILICILIGWLVRRVVVKRREKVVVK